MMTISKMASKMTAISYKCHNSVHIHTRKLFFVSIPRFWGSIYPLKVSIMLTWYYKNDNLQGGCQNGWQEGCQEVSTSAIISPALRTCQLPVSRFPIRAESGNAVTRSFLARFDFWARISPQVICSKTRYLHYTTISKYRLYTQKIRMKQRF